MTVETETNRVVHNGDGTTTVFTVPFRFLDNSHVDVIRRDTASAQADWTENTQYTLTGAGDAAGGTLTVITTPVDYTPQVNETLVILRDVPVTQESDYVENGPLPANRVETDFDKTTMVNQQQAEKFDRTFIVPESDNLAEGAFILPIDTERASKFLAFDSTGLPIASIGTAAGQTVPFSAFGESWVSAANKASARILLNDAPIVDVNSNELVKFVGIPVAVNEVTIVNAATGNGPRISVTGDDANISFIMQTKGAGVGRMLDGNGNDVLKTASGVASAVNELTVANAATGTGPDIQATGDDANIDVRITPKGTGALDVAGPIKRSGRVIAEEIIGRGTISNQPNLSIIDLPTGYVAFKLYFRDLLAATNTVDFQLRVSDDNGATYKTGAADYRSSAHGSNSAAATFQVANRDPGNGIRLNHAIQHGNTGSETGAGEITIYSARDVASATYISASMSYLTSATLSDVRAAGRRLLNEDNDAFQVLFTAGNIVSMDWTLTGVRES